MIFTLRPSRVIVAVPVLAHDPFKVALARELIEGRAMALHMAVVAQAGLTLT